LTDTTMELDRIGRNRWIYSAGAYWSIFASTFILIFLVSYIMYHLGTAYHQNSYEVPIKALRGILITVGFFLVWYGILTFILVAGSTSIATFCTFLGQINQGQYEVYDEYNFQYQMNKFGLSKQILKECTEGNSGNLLDFADAFTTDSSYSQSVVNDIKNSIIGISAYLAFQLNPRQTGGASSINFYNSALNLDKNGITMNFVGSFDQKEKLTELINGSVFAFNNATCALISTSGCIPLDNSANTGLLLSNANATMALPYFNNLNLFIASEVAVLDSIMSHLTTGPMSPQMTYSTLTNLLWSVQNEAKTVTNYIPQVMSSFGTSSLGYQAYNCKNIKTELYMLEDHLCFQLSYWVYSLTIFVGLSLVFLFILSWSMCAAIRNSHAEGLERQMNGAAMEEENDNKEKQYEEGNDLNENENIGGM